MKRPAHNVQERLTLNTAFISIARAWQRLMQPPPHIENIVTQHRVRLLHTMLAELSLLPLLMYFSDRIVMPDQEHNVLILAGTVIYLLTTMILFTLSKKGHHSIAIWTGIVLSLSMILAVILVLDRPYVVLGLLIIPILGSAYLNHLVTLLLGAFTVLILLALSIFVPIEGYNTPNLYFSFIWLFVPFYLLLLTANTARDRLEEDQLKIIQEGNSAMHMLITQLPALVWTLDTALQVTSVRGTGPASLGHNGAVLNEWLREHQTEHQRALTGESVSYDSTWDGLPYQTTVEPLRDENNIIIGCVGISLNVQDRVLREKQERQLSDERQRMHILGEFLRNASHDIKHPLSVIKTSTHLLSRTDDTERRDTYQTMLTDSVGSLEHILDDMFLMARLDMVALEDATPTRIDYVVDGVLTRYLSLAQQNIIKLNVDLPQDLPRILVNPRELTTAMGHLVQNGLQHATEGGSVSIEARTINQRGQQFVLIDVTDDGDGIPPEEIPHIFERFYRVEKSRQLEEPHTGLGLAIAKKIVESYGGELSVESQLGVGSIFRMVFPAEASEEASSEGPEEAIV